MVEWITLVTVPVFAALGALLGSWWDRKTHRESETWQTLRDLDHRLYSAQEAERRGAVAHIRQMLRAHALDDKQRAYARTSVSSYRAALEESVELSAEEGGED